MRYRTVPDLSYVLKLLRYERATGQFFWKFPRKGASPGGRAGARQKRGYWAITVDQKKYYEHQLVWYVETGRWPSHDIDHKDGSKLNNVYSNLRLATMSQNLANQKLSAVNTSGVKGVTLYQRGSCVRWVAQIHTMKKHYHLGYFKTKEAASAAYGEAAQKLFGTFSRPEHKKG